MCKGKRVYEKRRINVNKIKRIVASFVNQRMDPSKTKEAEEYIEVYTEILSDKRLYLSTSKMIEESARILKIEENDVRELKKLWHELSKYLHFSYPFLEAILNDPEFLLIEKSNDELLDKSLNFYFETLDFFYSVLAWRFSDLRDEIMKMIKCWKKL